MSVAHAFYASQTRYFFVGVTLLLLVLVTYRYSSRSRPPSGNSPILDSSVYSSSLTYYPEDTLFNDESLPETVVAIPRVAGAGGGGSHLGGVVLVLHGCGGSALNFFPKTNTCTMCTGEPHDTQIVATMHKYDLTVVAMSSEDRTHKCWSMNRDTPRVVARLNELASKHGWSEHTKLFAHGLSSGGYFASTLPFVRQRINMHLRGLCIQVASLHADAKAWETLDRHDDIAVAFAHMPRDKRTAKHVEHDASELRRIGVPVLVVEDHPHAVSAPWLETYARLAPSLARQLFDHLTAIRAVDSDGYLAYDPRGHEPEVVPSEIAQTLDATGARTLHEALYSAYAVHAIASASTPKVLDFWMKHAV